MQGHKYFITSSYSFLVYILIRMTYNMTEFKQFLNISEYKYSILMNFFANFNHELFIDFYLIVSKLLQLIQTLYSKLIFIFNLKKDIQVTLKVSHYIFSSCVFQIIRKKINDTKNYFLKCFTCII
jgi:hypothetical protein